MYAVAGRTGPLTVLFVLFIFVIATLLKGLYWATVYIIAGTGIVLRAVYMAVRRRKQRRKAAQRAQEVREAVAAQDVIREDVVRREVAARLAANHRATVRLYAGNQDRTLPYPVMSRVEYPRRQRG